MPLSPSRSSVCIKVRQMDRYCQRRAQKNKSPGSDGYNNNSPTIDGRNNNSPALSVHRDSQPSTSGGPDDDDDDYFSLSQAPPPPPSLVGPGCDGGLSVRKRRGFWSPAPSWSSSRPSDNSGTRRSVGSWKKPSLDRHSEYSAADRRLNTIASRDGGGGGEDSGSDCGDTLLSENTDNNNARAMSLPSFSQASLCSDDECRISRSEEYLPENVQDRELSLEEELFRVLDVIRKNRHSRLSSPLLETLANESTVAIGLDEWSDQCLYSQFASSHGTGKSGSRGVIAHRFPSNINDNSRACCYEADHSKARIDNLTYSVGCSGEDVNSEGEDNNSQGEDNSSKIEDYISTDEDNDSQGQDNSSEGEDNNSTGERNSTGEDRDSTVENNSSCEDNNSTGEDNNSASEDNNRKIEDVGSKSKDVGTEDEYDGSEGEIDIGKVENDISKGDSDTSIDEDDRLSTCQSDREVTTPSHHYLQSNNCSEVAGSILSQPSDALPCDSNHNRYVADNCFFDDRSEVSDSDIVSLVRSANEAPPFLLCQIHDTHPVPDSKAPRYRPRANPSTRSPPNSKTPPRKVRERQVPKPAVHSSNTFHTKEGTGGRTALRDNVKLLVWHICDNIKTLVVDRLHDSSPCDGKQAPGATTRGDKHTGEGKRGANTVNRGKEGTAGKQTSVATEVSPAHTRKNSKAQARREAVANTAGRDVVPHPTPASFVHGTSPHHSRAAMNDCSVSTGTYDRVTPPKQAAQINQHKHDLKSKTRDTQKQPAKRGKPAKRPASTGHKNGGNKPCGGQSERALPPLHVASIARKDTACKAEDNATVASAATAERTSSVRTEEGTTATPPAPAGTASRAGDGAFPCRKPKRGSAQSVRAQGETKKGTMKEGGATQTPARRKSAPVTRDKGSVKSLVSTASAPAAVATTAMVHKTKVRSQPPTAQTSPAMSCADVNPRSVPNTPERDLSKAVVYAQTSVGVTPDGSSATSVSVPLSDRDVASLSRPCSAPLSTIPETWRGKITTVCQTASTGKTSEQRCLSGQSTRTSSSGRPISGHAASQPTVCRARSRPDLRAAVSDSSRRSVSSLSPRCGNASDSQKPASRQAVTSRDGAAPKTRLSAIAAPACATLAKVSDAEKVGKGRSQGHSRGKSARGRTRSSQSAGTSTTPQGRSSTPGAASSPPRRSSAAGPPGGPHEKDTPPPFDPQAHARIVSDSSRLLLNAITLAMSDALEDLLKASKDVPTSARNLFAAASQVTENPTLIASLLDLITSAMAKRATSRGNKTRQGAGSCRRDQAKERGGHSQSCGFVKRECICN